MNYKIIVFDLDGTLVLSKTEIDSEMIELVVKLLDKFKVAVVSGAGLPQFERQFVNPILKSGHNPSDLLILPTSGSAFYEFTNGTWKCIYAEKLSEKEKTEILEALEKVVLNSDIELPDKTYGPVVEDRGSQISWSANGQDAPLEVKEAWDPDQNKRQKIRKMLLPLLPDFEIKIGGTNTIDITKKNLNKSYALQKIQEYTGFNKDEFLFIGDALYEGGNDSDVKNFGIQSISVSSVEETKKQIIKLLDLV